MAQQFFLNSFFSRMPLVLQQAESSGYAPARCTILFRSSDVFGLTAAKKWSYYTAVVVIPLCKNRAPQISIPHILESIFMGF